MAGVQSGAPAQGAHRTGWFIRRDGRELGPYPVEVVEAMVRRGGLDEGFRVSPDGERWHRPEMVLRGGRRHPEPTEPFEPSALTRRMYAHLGRERRRERLVLLALGVVLAAMTLLAIEAGGPQTRSRTDCAAPAAAGVDWAGCDMAQARLADADLAGARLAGIRLPLATLDGAGLERTDLSYAVLPGASIRAARAGGARLLGADLRGVDLTGTDLRQADLRYADLRDARLTGADLEGARLDRALWGEGVSCADGSVGGCVPVEAAPAR